MTRARTIWEQGREPGRQVVALGVALSLTLAALDLALGQGLGLLFDAGFVLTCVGLALLVRPQDFFRVGVLPPLLMLLVFVLVAATRPGALGHHDDGVVQSVISGLAGHGLALFGGYALCLAALGVRGKVLARPATEQAPVSR